MVRLDNIFVEPHLFFSRRLIRYLVSRDMHTYA